MKKSFLLSIVLLSLLLAPLSQAIAEVPRTLNYQGRLLDNSGQPFNQTVPVTFELYDSEFGGVKLWSETQNVSVEEGFFNVNLGDDTPINLPFDQQYWLQVTVANGSPYARTAFASVPHTFRAILSDSAEYALNLVDKALTLEMMSDAVREVVGGDVIGTYPELYLRDGVVVENIGQGEITQMMLSPNVTTPPSGPASGDLTGNYPDPLIAEGAIKTNRLADGAVTYEKIAPAMGPAGTILGWDGTEWVETDVATWEVDGVIGNEVLDATVDGGLVRSGAGTEIDPYTLGIMDGGVTNDMLAGGITGDKLADGTLGMNTWEPGTTIGQVAYWDGTEWTLTEDGDVPAQTQVLKWVFDPQTQTTGMAWADDEFTIPYAYEGGSVDSDNNAVTMLDLVMNDAQNHDQHVLWAEIADQEGGSAIVARGSGEIPNAGNMAVVDIEGFSDEAFFEGALKVVANVNTIHEGQSTGAYFEHNIEGTNDIDSETAGIYVTNVLEQAWPFTDHVGVYGESIIDDNDGNASNFGGDAWGLAGTAAGADAMNNVGAVGYAENGLVSVGVMGLANYDPALFFEDLDAGAIVYGIPASAGVVALNDNGDVDDLAIYAESNGLGDAIVGVAEDANAVFAANESLEATILAENAGDGSAIDAMNESNIEPTIFAENSGDYTTVMAMGDTELFPTTWTENIGDGAAFWAISNVAEFDGGDNDGTNNTLDYTSFTWNAGDGRAAAFVGGGLNDENGGMPYWADPTDADDAALVVYNPNSGGGNWATAIKTYGDIWANSAVGASQIIGLDEFVIAGGAGAFDPNDPATFGALTYGADAIVADGMAVIVDDDLVVNEDLNVMGNTFATDITADNIQVNQDLNVDGMTTLDETTVDGNFTVNGDTDLNGMLDVQDATTLQSTLNVAGDATFAANVQVDMDFNVDGMTTLDETTVAEYLDLGTEGAELQAVGGNWDFVGASWNVAATPSAGNSGDFLVSQGAGASPIWSNSAANLELNDLLLRNTFILDADGGVAPLDVFMDPNNLTFDDADVFIGNASGTRGNLDVANDLFVGNDGTITNNLSVLIGNVDVFTGDANIMSGDVNVDLGDANVAMGDVNVDNGDVNVLVGDVNAQGTIVNNATGTVVVDDNFNVTGNTDLDGDLLVNGNADVDMDLNVDGVIANATTGIVVADDDFNVTGNTDLDGDLLVNGNADVDMDLNVDGNSTFGTVDGAPGNYVQLNDETELRASTGGAVPAPGNVDDFLVSRGADLSPRWTNTLAVLTVDDLFVNDHLTLGADGDGMDDPIMEVLEGDVEITDNLDVLTGDISTGTGNISSGNDLIVANDAFVGNDLQVTNDAEIGNDLLVNVDADILGNLDVDGITDLDVTNIDGALTVQNNHPSFFTGNITVDGITQLNGFVDVNNSVDISNDLTVHNDLSVDGLSTLSDNVIAQANVTLQSGDLFLLGNNSQISMNAINQSINMSGAGAELNMTDPTSQINIYGTIVNTNAGMPVEVDDNLLVTGNMNVTGTSNLQGNVDAQNGVDILGGALTLPQNDGGESANGIFTQAHDTPLTVLTAEDDDLITALAVANALANLLEDGSGTTITDVDTDGAFEVNWTGPLTQNVVVDGTGAWDITFQNLATGFTVDADAVVTGTSNLQGDVDADANVNVDGNTTLNGNVDLGDAAADLITFMGEVDSHIIPDADATYDLGTNAQRWRDLYLDGASLHLGDVIGTEAMFGYAGNALSVSVDGNQRFTINDVTATATFVNTALDVDNTLNVDGGATFNSTINQVGGGQVTFSGNVDAMNGVDVLGGNLAVSNNANITGNLTVDGTSTLGDGNDLLTVNGPITQTGAANQVAFAGNVDAGNGMDVTGLTTMTGVVTQNGGQVTFNGNVDAANGLDVTGANFTVGGANFSVDVTNGNTNTAGTLTVAGATTLNSTLNVAGATTINNTINQTGGGQVTFSGNVDANNGLDVAGADLNVATNANITGNTQVTGDLNVDGITTLDATTVDGTFTQNGAADQVTLNGNVDATNGVDVTGADLNVALNANITGDANVTGNANITGNNDVTGNLIVDGTSTLGDGGDLTTINGPLTQNGAADQVTLNGNVDATNGVDVTGADLTVALNAVVTGNVDVAGVVTNNTAATALEINDADGVNITGNVDVNNDLNVDGASTFNNTINQTAGQVTFAGNVDANGGLDVTGVFTQGGAGDQATFNGNLDATNGLDVTGANLTVGTTTVDPATGNLSLGGSLLFDGETITGIANNTEVPLNPADNATIPTSGAVQTSIDAHDLQDAYDAGNAISVSGGNPVEISNGDAATNPLTVNLDNTATGNGVVINNASAAGATGLSVSNTAAGGGAAISVSNNANTDAITISQNGVGAGMSLTSFDGTSAAANIGNAGGGDALNVLTTGASTAITATTGGGIGVDVTATTGTGLDVNMTTGTGLNIQSNSNGNAGIVVNNTASAGRAMSVTDGGGTVKLSYGTVAVVGDAAVIPDDVSVVHLTSNDNGVNDVITLPAGTNGQFLYITITEAGDDDDFQLGAVYTTNGSAQVTLIFSGGSWRLVSAVE